ncbi:hypothetical protein [Actinomycetospora sp. CA-053990]
MAAPLALVGATLIAALALWAGVCLLGGSPDEGRRAALRWLGGG